MDSGNPILRKTSNVARPPLEKYYIYILTLTLGFAAADLTVLATRPAMLPSESMPSPRKAMQQVASAPRGSYSVIESKNIFSETGTIPPSLSAEGPEQQPGLDRPAVLSKLPLKLMGTIVHANPDKSVATINARNETASYKFDDEVEGMAQITKIERRKVTFINLNNRTKEYIEIPDDVKITFAKPVASPRQPTDSVVEARGLFDFSLKRSDLNEYTSNLSSILRQAKVLPNIVNGQPEGYKFVMIKPDSIFAKLGFQVGDVIKSVEGEPVNSPTKAMEMFNALKSRDRIALGIERDGKVEEFNYTVE